MGPILHTKQQGNCLFEGFFNIYGHGSHLGHVTKRPRIMSLPGSVVLHLRFAQCILYKFRFRFT